MKASTFIAHAGHYHADAQLKDGLSFMLVCCVVGGALAGALLIITVRIYTTRRSKPADKEEKP